MQSSRWGVTATALTTTSSPALALCTYKLTHIVHALHICFAVRKSFTCRRYEVFCTQPELFSNQSTKMPCKQLFTSAPAWHITSLVRKSICVTPHSYSSVRVNYASTLIQFSYQLLVVYKSSRICIIVVLTFKIHLCKNNHFSNLRKAFHSNSEFSNYLTGLLTSLPTLTPASLDT